MHQKDYGPQLLSFMQDITDLRNPAFAGIEKLTMCHDLQNGVKIANAVTNEFDRKLLHEVGQKHGLIPLCPNELVGLDLTEKGEINFAVVETTFGRLKIEPMKR